jgi:hypothetical protein
VLAAAIALTVSAAVAGCSPLVTVASESAPAAVPAPPSTAAPDGRAPQDRATPRAMPDPSVSGGLPRAVPFVAGGSTLVVAEIIGEFTPTPRVRWIVRIVADPAALLPAQSPILAAHDRLRDAGYTLIDQDPSFTRLRMSRDEFTVEVHAEAAVPWLLDYTVTRTLSIGERRPGCATAACER